MNDLFGFDAAYYENGVGLLCGVDEAGRGPLAGPVFAAAVILPRGVVIDGLNDSKKLTESKREFLYDQIINTAVAYGIAYATEAEIDEYNILQATFLAMRRAVDQLGSLPGCILVDGNRMPPLPSPAECVVKGDAKSACIAAASILAKVSRDRLLYELDKQYPQYCFGQHKGYPTELHYEMLIRYGVSPVHRKSFLKNLSEKSHA
ncbi:ribonuclease HII [Acetanaerobacterium elongatum]|uniref:Ribonuclease HII n=1 Tax=Acetanaerobacterium elongatum TaxID=258515 RepID=A0A1H0B9Z9_9FIRM|nr:ribonuclease HII [Acetanaerobacterium elongatum]SDN42449.1 RNase HII [Acetanaerobacterium elongatum]